MQRYLLRRSLKLMNFIDNVSCSITTTFSMVITISFILKLYAIPSLPPANILWTGLGDSGMET
jgi:hypothetical protein